MHKRYRDYQPHFDLAPSNDFEWIQTQSGLPWLALDIAVPVDAIAEEIKRIEPRLVDHREEYASDQGWKSFCIHGKAWDATREDSYYQDDRPYVWTDLAQELMPRTVEFFKNSWPGTEYYRIRVMLLEPGGYVAVHQDYSEHALKPINIAITQPAECRFVMEKYGTVPFNTGSALWLDIANRHVVFNDSDQPRWHIIVHQNTQDKQFKKTVVKSYEMLYNSLNETMHNSN
jgi:hypothetical protein